jgi:hypothetical protein
VESCVHALCVQPYNSNSDSKTEMEENSMETVQNGQCGLCTHFGEHHKTDVLVSIMTSHQADLKFLEECGHPRHADLHLKVTPISGCDGFEQVH